MDPVVRKKIELWAEDRAIEHFTELGWTTVERVGHFRPYDLECKNEEVGRRRLITRQHLQQFLGVAS
jgi:hypothetical protein